MPKASKRRRRFTIQASVVWAVTARSVAREQPGVSVGEGGRGAWTERDLGHTEGAVDVEQLVAAGDDRPLRLVVGADRDPLRQPVAQLAAAAVRVAALEQRVERLAV